MKGPTHELIGVSLALTAGSVTGASIGETGGLAAAAYVSSRLPDRLEGLLPHRTVTHWLITCATLSAAVLLGLSLALPDGVATLLGLGFALGYAAHLAADACTPHGVPALAPFSWRCWWLLPRWARIRTGSAGEGLLALLVVCVTAGVLLLTLPAESQAGVEHRLDRLNAAASRYWEAEPPDGALLVDRLRAQCGTTASGWPAMHVLLVDEPPARAGAPPRGWIGDGVWAPEGWVADGCTWLLDFAEWVYWNEARDGRYLWIEDGCPLALHEYGHLALLMRPLLPALHHSWPGVMTEVGAWWEYRPCRRLMRVERRRLRR